MACSRLSLPRAVPAACCVWRAAAVPRHDDGGWRARIAPPPRPQASPPVRRAPAAASAPAVLELPSPRCVARRAGAPSAMRQLGELLQETPALHPTSAGSAISRIVLSFRAKGAIVPAGCAAPAAALPLARTSRCARKRGPLVVRTSRASSLNFGPASRSRACRRRTASRGGARRRFTPELGAARVTRERAARTRGGPGDPRTLTRARCMVLSRAHSNDITAAAS